MPDLVYFYRESPTSSPLPNYFKWYYPGSSPSLLFNDTKILQPLQLIPGLINFVSDFPDFYIFRRSNVKICISPSVSSIRDGSPHESSIWRFELFCLFFLRSWRHCHMVVPEWLNQIVQIDIFDFLRVNFSSLKFPHMGTSSFVIRYPITKTT